MDDWNTDKTSRSQSYSFYLDGFGTYINHGGFVNDLIQRLPKTSICIYFV